MILPTGPDEPIRFTAGQTIFAVGDPADAAYLLLWGEVTLELDLDGTLP